MESDQETAKQGTQYPDLKGEASLYSMTLADSAWAIHCIWRRYFDVFRKSVGYYLITTFMEPFLYLLSFGWGVGTMIGTLHLHGMEVDYKRFVFSGIIGQVLLFQGFFEASYGGFIRMYYQKIFHAMSTTPITLSEVLWGELLWDATKATVASEVVALIGVAFGMFPPISLLLLLPLSFLCALLFSGLGLMVAAFSKTIEQISYPQYLLVYPMFLFSGVFYPIETLPVPFQWLAWTLPLTSLISLIRTITLGFPFQAIAIPILLFWLVGLVWLSRRSMFRRLVK